MFSVVNDEKPVEFEKQPVEVQENQPVIFEKSIEYDPSWQTQNRKMSTYNWLDFGNTRILTDYAQISHQTLCPLLSYLTYRLHLIKFQIEQDEWVLNGYFFRLRIWNMPFTFSTKVIEIEAIATFLKAHMTFLFIRTKWRLSCSWIGHRSPPPSPPEKMCWLLNLEWLSFFLSTQSNLFQHTWFFWYPFLGATSNHIPFKYTLPSLTSCSWQPKCMYF